MNSLIRSSGIQVCAPSLTPVLVPLGFDQHLPAVPFEVLTPAFERFSASPVTKSFQSATLLFQRFAAVDFSASNLFLPLGASVPSILRRRVTYRSYDQH